MPEMPDSTVHWLLGCLAVTVPGLFLFLLKRFFNDFEGKLAGLFKTMEATLEKQQVHDTRIQLLDQRLDVLGRALEEHKTRCHRKR